MKRVLLISYYFPPSGGSGVQRALKFARYLPDYGWRPTVLTVRPEDAAYPDLDPSLYEEVPEAVRVVRTRAWDPYTLYARLLGKAKGETVSVGFVGHEGAGWQERLSRWLRANLFLPDARVGWVPFAIRAGRRLLRETPFDLVCTSGPPHSTHLVGRALRKASGLPWVADFRDPWTDISYYDELPMTGVARALDAALERAVLGGADAVVSVSEGFGRLLQAKARLRRYETIYNGFDPADVPEGGPEAPDPDGFTITHVGMLSARQHAPGLAAALAARTGSDAAWRARLRVRFVGRVDGAVVQAFEDAGLGPWVERLPYVPHAEAVRYMRGADVLVAAVQRVPKNEGIVPAKIYEYMRAGVPVLGFGPPSGDMAAILRHTGGGEVFAPDDAEGVGRLLDRHFERVGAGRPPVSPDERALAHYDRRHLSRKLALLFDDLAGQAR